MDYIGWIKSYRKMQNNWIWRYKEPYDRRSAWQYILFQAYYKDDKIMNKGELVLVKRGQFPTSVRDLADKWMWSIGKVQRFLDALEAEHMVERSRLKNGTLITVVNYEIYQDERYTDDTEIGTLTDTQTIQSRNTDEYANDTLAIHNKRNKEYKEDKKEKNNICAPEPHDTDQPDDTQKFKDSVLEEFYDSIWKLYPIKKGKGQVSKTQKQKLQRIGFDEIKRCVDRYLAECEKENTETQYMVNGSTFFNSRYVDYLDKNYLPETANSSVAETNEPDKADKPKQEKYLGEVPDIPEEDYIDFGAMTDEEFEKFLRVHG